MKPLNGKRVLVTRSKEQAPALCEKFEAVGATAVSFPVIQFEAVQSEEVAQAMAQLERYDWILFTSVNGVRFFLQNAPSNWRPACTAKIGAVGSATVKALHENGINADFVPEQFTGEELATGLGDVTNKRILIPRASVGRPEITDSLREGGALVADVGLYETITAVPTPAALVQLDQPLDVITFTSPSSVRNFFKIINANNHKHRMFGSKPPTIACIGPSTAEGAKQFGLTVGIMPDEYTIDELVQAVVDFFKVDSD